MTQRTIGLCCALSLASLLGCGPNADLGDGTGDGGVGDGADADTTRADALPPPENAAVYAHSASVLYRVDPDTLDVTMVGAFTGLDALDDITDIAIDKDGNMIAISFDAVYSVVKETAAATKLADLQGGLDFNGLSFVPGVGPDPNAPERLIGAVNDASGAVYEINPTTGAATQVGSYGGGWRSSGDIVSVRGFGTVATAHQGGLTETDTLVRLDPSTFTATPIGDTGFQDIWGVGFWEDKVFGFTEGQRFVLIDTSTGAGSEVEVSGVDWWGAAVTTSAPVIE